MNKATVKHVILICILLMASLTGGCLKKSSPVYHYTLNSVNREQLTPSSRNVPTILVGPIRIASFLNQGPIVSRKNDTAVSISELHRWAGPLPEMLTNTLISNLSKQLNSDSVFSFPDSSKDKGLRVEMTIVHFERGVKQTALMEVRYRILSSNDSSILHARTSRFTVQLQDNSYDTLVRGLSTCMTRLGSEISEQILLVSPST
jgi:uncharacterized lipoprotein YmbA